MFRFWVSLTILACVGCSSGGDASLPKLCGPVLIVHRPPLTGARNEHPSVEMVLGGVSGVRRARLIEDLSQLGDAAEREANPFYISLEDDNARERARALGERWRAAYVGARLFLEGPVASPGAEASVSVASSCPPHAECRCAWEVERSDAHQDHVHFLVAPLSYSIVLRARTPEDSERIAESLRIATDSTSTIALVLSASSLEPQRERRRIRDLAERVTRLFGPGESTMLEALASAPATMPPWVRELFEDPSVVVIVPKMSAVHRLDAFDEEVLREVSELDTEVEWWVGRAPR